MDAEATLPAKPRRGAPRETLAGLRTQLRRSEMLIKLTQRVAAIVERLAASAGLTPREAEVLHWLLHGHRYDDIATVLDITPRTTKFHASNLLRKLELDRDRRRQRRAIFGQAFGALWATVSQTVGGIFQAMLAGRWDLAAEVA